VSRIRDQQGGRAGPVRGQDLADDAVGVDQGLACVNAVEPALVDHDLLTERIQVHRQELGDLHPLRGLRGGMQERAQTVVLRLQGIEAQLPRA
jgi:hypothetical protein